MDRLLATLPKPVIAILAILVGFIFIRLNDPPKTVCDTQMGFFRESQKAFLYPSTKNGIKIPAVVNELHALCRSENNPGGCFELFVQMKKLLRDLENIPAECAVAAASEREIAEWLPKNLDLMVKIAWGERAPASFTQKHAWFDSSDIALFCQLSRVSERLLGAQRHAQWRESVLKSLPDAAKFDRNQLWQRSLFSTGCQIYR